MSQSPFQRFVTELRRRRVPQTAAIYLVAAWAAIEFADVVVPNLNGPQWIVTAVIVAALVGFPVLLVLAWVFEWGPEGLHRTEDVDVGRLEPSRDPVAGTGPSHARRTGPADRTQPWLAVLAVLVVGIGSAVGVAYVLRGGDGASAEGSRGAERSAPAMADRDGAGQDGREAGEGGPPGSGVGVPPAPPVPGTDEFGEAFVDSMGRQIFRALSALDSLDLGSLAELGQLGERGREAAVDAGLAVLIIEPREWRGGDGVVPVQLAEGDTLRVRGVAVDSAGVAAVTLDGETLVEPAEPAETVPFTATVIGRAAAGVRPVAITVLTVDGREVGRTFRIVQLPGGTP